MSWGAKRNGVRIQWSGLQFWGAFQISFWDTRALGKSLSPSLSLVHVVLEGLTHPLSLGGGSDSGLVNEINRLPWLQDQKAQAEQPRGTDFPLGRLFGTIT